MAKVATEDRPALKASELKAQWTARRRDWLRSIMDTPHGRAFISEFLGECGIHRAGFRESAMLLAYEQGERTIGLALYEECRLAAPRSFLLMEAEKAQRAASDQRELDAAEKDAKDEFNE